jgi:N-acyl-D-aspartate/D-glutamate deacylase
MLQHPLGMVSTDMGSIDEFPKGPEGLPAAGHPRTYATYPELLRRFVLTGKAVTVEEAIRKSTSLPARSMKLQDRGTLKVGAWADVVVIDLDNVAPVATYEDPHQYPKGVDYVLVNGVPVVDCGKPTGRTPGKMLVRR